MAPDGLRGTLSVVEGLDPYASCFSPSYKLEEALLIMWFPLRITKLSVWKQFLEPYSLRNGRYIVDLMCDCLKTTLELNHLKRLSTWDHRLRALNERSQNVCSWKKKTSSYAFHKADVQLIKTLLEVFALLSERASSDAQADLAQLVEQHIRNVQVTGSTPAIGITSK